MIPPFMQQIIGLVVRWLVVVVTTYLAAHAGIAVSEDQIGKIVTYLTPILAMVAWDYYRTHRGRLKFLTAAGAGHALSEHEVEAIVRDPALQNPSLNTPKDEVPK